MARILLTGWPYPGALHPLLAIAHALAERGHEVAFYTGSQARALVEGQGFACFVLGRALDDHIRSLMRGSAGIGQRWSLSPGRIVAMMEALFLAPVEGQVAELDAILDSWQPAAIVTDKSFWGPRLIVHEARRIPVAMLELSFSTLPGPDVAPVGLGLPPPHSRTTRLRARLGRLLVAYLGRRIRRGVNELRRAHGLPPLRGSVTAQIARLPLVLVPSCPEYDYQRRDLPPTVHYIGHCAWYPTDPADPDPLAGLPRDLPWIHASEGTLYAGEPLILRAVARGLADRPVQVILSTGRHRSMAALELGELAPNVLALPWVSHSALLPRIDVFVSHGGGGAVMAALAAGVPMVVVPLMWDQFEIARRVELAGAGLRLSSGRCTPGRMRAAVETVLAAPALRRHAAHLAACLARCGGPPRAAELIEGLV